MDFSPFSVAFTVPELEHNSILFPWTISVASVGLDLKIVESYEITRSTLALGHHDLPVGPTCKNARTKLKYKV
jgi:hypothetical protein